MGRNKAVAEFGKLHIAGFPAWFTWVFVHLMYLVEFDNRLLVFLSAFGGFAKLIHLHGRIKFRRFP